MRNSTVAIRHAEWFAQRTKVRAMAHYQRQAKRLLQRNVTWAELNEVYTVGLLPAVFPMPVIALEFELYPDSVALLANSRTVWHKTS